MHPKISDPVAWQQAETLMQPAFIRLLDRIRNQIDQSDWQGNFENVLIWPVGTTDETKVIVTQLLQKLEGANPEQIEAIERSLASMPTPHPGYDLCLKRQDQVFKVDMWELCYQVCFQNYRASVDESGNYAVEVDTSLLDETGDVDWERLDAKAKELIEQIFANLPTA